MDFQPDYYNPSSRQPTDKSSPSMAFASIAFGFVSVIGSCFGTSLIFGSIGLILALLSRGGSNTYTKPTITGLILNTIGIIIGAMMILVSIIVIISFGSLDNFMNATQNYLDAYYSAIGTM